MHIADPSVGVLGANGIVAGGLPMATGAALPHRCARRRPRRRRLLRRRRGGPGRCSTRRSTWPPQLRSAGAVRLREQRVLGVHPHAVARPALRSPSGRAGYRVRYRPRRRQRRRSGHRRRHEEVERLRRGEGPAAARDRDAPRPRPLRGRSAGATGRRRRRLRGRDPLAALEARLRRRSATTPDELAALRRERRGAHVRPGATWRCTIPRPTRLTSLDEHVRPEALGELPPLGPAIQERTRISQALRAALDDELAADDTCLRRRHRRRRRRRRVRDHQGARRQVPRHA